MSGGIAFFDVDGTVTRINGMFRFLRYVLSRQDRAAEYDHAMAQLRALTAAGSPREHTNRLYFRSYAGMRWAELLRLGMEWFTVEEAAGAALYNDGAVRALRAHQESGTAVVLVSGSFEPCLAPLAVHLGVSAVECTRPEVTASGRLTGVVRHPMIGAAKAAAVNEVTARSGVDPARCFAYGDHLSDLPMLEAVGHPVAVGTDPGLAERAERAGSAAGSTPLCRRGGRSRPNTLTCVRRLSPNLTLRKRFPHRTDGDPHRGVPTPALCMPAIPRPRAWSAPRRGQAAPSGEALS